MIRITSLQAGFRRCGIDHPVTATDHPDGAFTQDELEVLKAEPMLKVETIEEEKKKAGK